MTLPLDMLPLAGVVRWAGDMRADEEAWSALEGWPYVKTPECLLWPSSVAHVAPPLRRPSQGTAAVVDLDS
jgi:hypothetical protein